MARLERYPFYSPAKGYFFTPEPMFCWLFGHRLTLVGNGLYQCDRSSCLCLFAVKGTMTKQEEGWRPVGFEREANRE